MTLRYFPGARERVQSLPPTARRALKAALDDLARGSADADVRRLQGNFLFPLERLKVGAWRAAFYREGRGIHVLHVFPRSEGYDWLEMWELP